jgi:hypothetical protein
VNLYDPTIIPKIHRMGSRKPPPLTLRPATLHNGRQEYERNVRFLGERYQR